MLIILAGSIGRFPVGGHAWVDMQYLFGLRDIGHEVIYLEDCGARCQVVLGDGRLSLLQAPPHKYGLVILDAFSSDAIPVHLLTSEALSLYLTRLSPGGAIAFHISNRHLSLGPMLGRLAASHGLVAVEQMQPASHAEVEAGKSASDWMIMARSEADLGVLASDPRWRKPSTRRR